MPWFAGIRKKSVGTNTSSFSDQVKASYHSIFFLFHRQKVIFKCVYVGLQHLHLPILLLHIPLIRFQIATRVPSRHLDVVYFFLESEYTHLVHLLESLQFPALHLQLLLDRQLSRPVLHYIGELGLVEGHQFLSLPDFLGKLFLHLLLFLRSSKFVSVRNINHFGNPFEAVLEAHGISLGAVEALDFGEIRLEQVIFWGDIS